MPEIRKQLLDEDDLSLFSEPLEQALAALQEYLSVVAEDRAPGARLQARAEVARDTIAAARGEWWRTETEVRALTQRVARLEGEVARLERHVGKMTSALDESEWVTGA